ncbi:hypothetical protein QUB22_09965 [Microcoleus sp. AT9_A5]
MVHEAGGALHCVNAPYDLKISSYQAEPGNEYLEAMPRLTNSTNYKLLPPA